jgi:hypothetical protein
MRALWELRQKASQGVSVRRPSQPRPDEGLESGPRHPLGHPLREAGQVIAEFLGTFAALDEVPVGQLLGLGDLFRRKPRDCVEPGSLLLRPRGFLGLGGFFRHVLRFGGRSFCFRVTLRGFRLGKRTLEGLNEPLRVRLETLLRQPDRISARERLQGFRQRVCARHLGLVHQHRNDVFAESQRRFDLDANEILWILQAPPPCFVFHGQPIVADQHQHRIASADLLLDHPHKILPRPNAALDIHEQVF